MPSRRLVAMEVAAIVVAVVVLVAGCSVRAVDPRRTPAATPATSSATPKVRYFTAPPIGVVKNPAARCIDATLPNITLDDYLADWRTIFADQRNAHPEGSFPTDAGSDAQRSERWASAPQILADITPGADARFAADVCGLSTIDGALYSGLELRKLRGHVASLGRETCITIADDGTKAVWERSRSLSRDDGQRLASEYQDLFSDQERLPTTRRLHRAAQPDSEVLRVSARSIRTRGRRLHLSRWLNPAGVPRMISSSSPHLWCPADARYAR